jgi:predicted aspartyl protease
MGIVHVNGTVTGSKGKESLRFIVDSGSKYSLLPEKVWRKIGIEPKYEMDFSLVDGTIIKRNISECYIELEVGAAHTPVILGEAQDEALLGVITLEILGVVINPFTREIQPMRLTLA